MRGLTCAFCKQLAVRRALYKGEWKPACGKDYKRIWRTGEPIAGIKLYQRRSRRRILSEKARRMKAAGFTNPEIARMFGVTERSVRRWRKQP